MRLPQHLTQGDPFLELSDFFNALRRYWVIVLAATLAGLLVGGAASMLARPSYTAKTQLFVAIQSTGTASDLQQGNTFGQARVQSYVKTVTTPIVLQPAIDSLGLGTSAADLARQITATADVNTVLINIAVVDGSPVQAAAIAQAVSSSLIEAVKTLESPKSGGPSPVNLSIIQPAQAPTTPSAPNTQLNLLVGLLIGIAAGVGAAALRKTFDNRLRGEPDLRAVTDAPLLGAISFNQDAMRKPLLTQAASQSPRAESFRQLRTNLQFANVTGRAKSLLVTSSLPGEGKTTTATNLAIALSQSGQTVCLVDADLRRPMVNEYLGVSRDAGLTTALLGSADVNDLLQPWGEGNLFVLASGQIPPNPSELLGSGEMKDLIKRLEEAFDVVIIDAPPLLPVTDAAVLVQHVGGVVVVVGSNSIKRNELAKSLQALELVGAKLLGVVLNRLPVKGADAYPYAYSSYHSFADSGIPQLTHESRGIDHVLTSATSFDTLLEPTLRQPKPFPENLPK
jgi:capsular exopolysaccharide synthesis family protein